jgi:hypothetical protein
MKTENIDSVDRVIRFLLDYIIECDETDNCGRCDMARKAVSYLGTMTKKLIGTPIVEEDYYHTITTTPLNEIQKILSITDKKELNSILSGYKAIMKALESDETNTLELDCFQLESMEYVPYSFPDFRESNLEPKEIWKCEYWEGSPGSNQIYLYDYDGKKICVWVGSNWDFPLMFMKQI